MQEFQQVNTQSPAINATTTVIDQDRSNNGLSENIEASEADMNV